jgi:hypothetical protein
MVYQNDDVVLFELFTAGQSEALVGSFPMTVAQLTELGIVSGEAVYLGLGLTGDQLDDLAVLPTGLYTISTTVTREAVVYRTATNLLQWTAATAVPPSTSQQVVGITNRDASADITLAQLQALSYFDMPQWQVDGHDVVLTDEDSVLFELLSLDGSKVIVASELSTIAQLKEFNILQDGNKLALVNGLTEAKMASIKRLTDSPLDAPYEIRMTVYKAGYQPLVAHGLGLLLRSNRAR